MTIANIGVCYYPEHWPEADWSAQAALMREAGILQVRIAEFAWSRIEPRPGMLVWDWLDRAVETLAAADLQIIMCTPTACPPRWLVAQLPEILPVDDQGRVVRYGPKSQVLSPPFDDYTDLLLSSVPEMKLGWLEEVLANRKMESAGN